MRTWISLVLALLLALAVAYFVAANLQAVPVHLPGVTLEEPLWMLLLVAVLAGAAIALRLAPSETAHPFASAARGRRPTR